MSSNVIRRGSSGCCVVVFHSGGAIYQTEYIGSDPGYLLY